MKKMVRTIASLLAATSLMFCVMGCNSDVAAEEETSEDWSTAIKSDDVSGDFLNFTNAVIGEDGCATEIVASNEDVKLGVKGSLDDWAAEQKGVLSIVSENDSPKVLKFVPSDKGAYQWYIGAWLNSNAPDLTEKVMTMKFYVSEGIVGSSDNSPNVKLLFKDTSWGEQKFVDESVYTLKAGWHTLVVNFKTGSAKLDGTEVAEAQNSADYSTASVVNEIDLALDAGSCTKEIGDGFLLLESVALADAE